MSHLSDRSVARLLPWTGPDGRTCYLLTDRAGAGRVSRHADQVEEVHLAMGLGLLEHAEPLIDDPAADAGSCGSCRRSSARRCGTPYGSRRAAGTCWRSTGGATARKARRRSR
ncbi:hypothetical protein O1L55_11650 [Streptomyces albulus]|nr:hypothetical protein [Streptomyces noursei]